jgi:hypothetical protein
MHNNHLVYLTNEQRLFPFPYPLKRIAYFPGIFDVLFFYFVIKSGDSKISSDRVLDRKEIK